MFQIRKIRRKKCFKLEKLETHSSGQAPRMYEPYEQTSSELFAKILSMNAP